MVSTPVGSSSHSPLTTISAASWSETAQAFTLFRAVVAQSQSLAEDTLAASLLVTLAVPETDRLLETRLVVDAGKGGNGPSAVTVRCDYLRQQ
jgi:hypothetical protein